MVSCRGRRLGKTAEDKLVNTARIATTTALCLICFVIFAGRAPGADGSGPRDNDALVHQLLVEGEDTSRRWMNGDSTGMRI